MSWIGDFFGASDRRKSRQEAAKADAEAARAEEYQRRQLQTSDERRTAQLGVANAMQERQDAIYNPMEERLAAQLAEGADTEGAAAQGRDDFTGAFDRATDAQRRELSRYGVQPGAEQRRRFERENAFDRARGEASAGNEARRLADDEQFLKESQFFSQNGSRLQQNLISAFGNAYGNDYDAQGVAANQALGHNARHQQNSDRFAQQANAGMNFLGQIAGMGTSLLGANMMAGGAGAGAAATGAAATVPATVASGTRQKAFGGGGFGTALFNRGASMAGRQAINAFSDGVNVPQNGTPNKNRLMKDTGLLQQKQAFPGATQGRNLNR